MTIAPRIQDTSDVMIAAEDVQRITEVSSWRTHRALFISGVYDSLKSAPGSEYPSLTLGELADRIRGPAPNGLKGSAGGVILSSYCAHDGRNADAQRRHGQYVALVADLDKGDVGLEQLSDAVQDIVGDAAFIMHSTSRATAEVPKWRVFIPLVEPLGFEAWQCLQLGLIDALAKHGIEADRSATKAAQVMYLPAFPPELRRDDGTPRFYRRVLRDAAPGWDASKGTLEAFARAAREQRSQQLAAAEAERVLAQARRAELRSRSQGGETPIERANCYLLEKHGGIIELASEFGYEPDPSNLSHLRSPLQTSGSFATRLQPDGETLFSLSNSDAEAGLGLATSDGRLIDAIDLLAHFQYGGDKRAALAAVLAEADRTDPAEDFAVPWVGTEPRPSLPSNIVSFGESASELEAPVYCIHKVLQTGCLYSLTAPPGHAKTATALTAALHVACGIPFHGHKVAQGRVLFLAGENPADVRLRALAAVQTFQLDRVTLDRNLYFTRRPFAIDDRSQLQAFIDEAQEHGPYALVIIDTGPAHSSADDENDNRSMHELAMNMRHLLEPLGYPAILALMHPPKGASRDTLTPRGGGAFAGSIDGELCCWKDGQQVELFHRTKFRGPGFAPMWFELKPFTFDGLDDNFGESVQTVVAVPAHQPQGGRAKPRSGAQRIAVEALRECRHDQGQRPPADIVEVLGPDAPPVVVHETDWRARCVELGFSEGTEAAQAKAFRRVRTALLDSGLVMTRNGYYWEASWVGTAGG